MSPEARGTARGRGRGELFAPVVLAALGAVLAAVAPLPAQETREEPAAGVEQARPDDDRFTDATSPVVEETLDAEGEVLPAFTPEPRKALVPWIVDVYGRNYQDFTNEGASRVISDWLTNALIDLKLFHVVNRERIRAVLSERNLALSGLARNTGGDVPENELATAGKLLSVNYILLGNVKNLGVNSEIDFKLLDVETTTYSPIFRLNFQTPFNPSIEKFKPVVDRVVASLAAAFPVTTGVREVDSRGHLILRAGSESGLVEGLAAELWSHYGARRVGAGVISAVWPHEAEMILEEPVATVDLRSSVVKVAIAPGPEAVLSAGKLEMRRGNIEKARDIFAAGLEKHPGHGRIVAFHARACRQLQDYDGAVASYRAAIRAEPNDVELFEEAVQVLLEAGKFQEVVELLRETTLGSRSVDLELKLGDALAVQGYPLKAREAYKRAFRLDPGNARPHLRLAVLAARSRELGEIERELRLAREGDANAVDVGLVSAVFSGLRQTPPDLSGAKPWIDRAVADRNFGALAMASEVALLESALWESALALAEKSVELNPDFVRGRILMAEAHVRGGDTTRALAELEEALESHPNGVALLVRSGELLAAAGQYEKAELRLLQARDLAPNQWRASDALGDSQMQQGQYLKAIDAYQTALRIAEATEALDLTTRLRKLGRAAVLGGQHSTAQPFLERCVDEAPDDRECRHHLGLCYYHSNLPESDEKAIVNLKASQGFDIDGYHYLGAIYDRREELETARDWYQECVDTGCSLAEESQRRVDEIETIRGTVISQPRKLKEVTIDRGRIHGVLPSQIGMVISGDQIIARIRTDQVTEKTSVAVVQEGKPLTGHTVVFRPVRPRNLRVKPAAKRGVSLVWHNSREPGLEAFVVQRREAGEPQWSNKKRVGGDLSNFVDRSAKPGHAYEYRVVALGKFKRESLPSLAVEIRLDE